ncbi:PREDICTED: 5-hydroxytryptamine receptor 3A-like [Nanorana parkeri]|uniref:5-hydroxytryptamine receptor 3A-like n=1 Tax=Nanorana parkeri TaxID=125878 RepID=UPI0008548A4E|nr:PREDICTED: 5-hydroxytryptamine receptor 3A-like [Nanorana parkeri]
MSCRCICWLLTATLLGTCYCSNSSCSFNGVVQALRNVPGSDVRPVKNWTTPTIVYIDMSLYTIVSLNTALQTMTTYLWFNMAWPNEFISWDPDVYCGIEQILIPGNNFWLPDLYIYEMTESDNNVPVIPYYTVTHEGKIINSKPLRIVSSCKLNIFKFPFDEQTCSLTFGSYIHSVENIIMLAKANSSQVNKNSKDIFVSKGDWKLVTINVEDGNVTSEGVTFSEVKYKIILKRTPIVYIINLIVPACFMVFLDISSMFIELGTGERLGFKITVVLGFSVLLLILNDMLPNSDNPPVLGVFCCVCLAVMVISIIGSIFTSYMLMLSETQPTVPNWIKIWIMKHLARILLFNVKAHKQSKLMEIDTEQGNTVNRPIMAIEMRKQDSPGGMKVPVEVKLLKRLLLEVLKIHQELIRSKSQVDAKSDWHFAAIVVDRLVLIVYLIIVITMFAVVINVWAT